MPTDLKSLKPVPTMGKVLEDDRRGEDWTAIGVSPHMRSYKYDWRKQQCILKHDDYSMCRFRRDPDGTFWEEATFITCLVYLNQEFEGGETRFWPNYATGDSKASCRFQRSDPSKKRSNRTSAGVGGAYKPGAHRFADADFGVKPVTGMALISDHMVQHEAPAPDKGDKYVLRTDILHQRPVAEARVTLDWLSKTSAYTEWRRNYEPSCMHYAE